MTKDQKTELSFAQIAMNKDQKTKLSLAQISMTKDQMEDVSWTWPPFTCFFFK